MLRLYKYIGGIVVLLLILLNIVLFARCSMLKSVELIDIVEVDNEITKDSQAVTRDLLGIDRDELIRMLNQLPTDPSPTLPVGMDDTELGERGQEDNGQYVH